MTRLIVTLNRNGWREVLRDCHYDEQQGHNFIELLSTNNLLSMKFNHWQKQDYQPNFHLLHIACLFSYCLLILKITWIFGWKSCFIQGKNVMLSKFVCLVALRNWTQNINTCKYDWISLKLSDHWTLIISIRPCSLQNADKIRKRGLVVSTLIKITYNGIYALFVPYR